jgi:hypothetical protein
MNYISAGIFLLTVIGSGILLCVSSWKRPRRQELTRSTVPTMLTGDEQAMLACLRARPGIQQDLALARGPGRAEWVN